MLWRRWRGEEDDRGLEGGGAAPLTEEGVLEVGGDDSGCARGPAPPGPPGLARADEEALDGELAEAERASLPGKESRVMKFYSSAARGLGPCVGLTRRRVGPGGREVAAVSVLEVVRPRGGSAGAQQEGRVAVVVVVVVRGGVGRSSGGRVGGRGRRGQRQGRGVALQQLLDLQVGPATKRQDVKTSERPRKARFEAETRSTTYLSRCSSPDFSVNSCSRSCWAIGRVSPNLKNCCKIKCSSSLLHRVQRSSGAPRGS